MYYELMCLIVVCLRVNVLLWQALVEILHNFKINYNNTYYLVRAIFLRINSFSSYVERDHNLHFIYKCLLFEMSPQIIHPIHNQIFGTAVPSDSVIAWIKLAWMYAVRTYFKFCEKTFKKSIGYLTI